MGRFLPFAAMLLALSAPANADGPKFIRVAPQETESDASASGWSLLGFLLGTNELQPLRTDEPYSRMRYMHDGNGRKSVVSGSRSRRILYFDHGDGNRHYRPWPYRSGTAHRTSPKPTVNRSVSKSRVSRKISKRY